MADVDEVGFAKRLGDAIVDRTQPVMLGNQRAQLVDVGDPELVGVGFGEVSRWPEIVQSAGGPDAQIVGRPGQCREVGYRKAKQQLVISDAAVYVVAVSRKVI